MSKHLCKIQTLFACISALVCCLSTLVSANNLKIENLQLLDQECLQFDISWDNAWNLSNTNTPNNFDAVWIFAKIKINHQDWTHLKVSDKPQDYQISSNQVNVQTNKDQRGFMLTTNLEGVGNISKTSIQFKLNTSLDKEQNINIRLFGIEMVYIPEGAFYLGDETAQNTMSSFDEGMPYLMESEAAFELNTTEGLLVPSRISMPSPRTVPSDYPKGYQAFYCMKYEITQAQYTDFLNTLNATQQSQRVAANIYAPVETPAMGEGYRNGIVIQSSAEWGRAAQFACNLNKDAILENSDDGQNIACNFLNGADVLAYLDWAALRPMTELEFEKLCRGPIYPKPKEFAWGTAQVSNTTQLLNGGTANEIVTDSISLESGLCNYNYSPIQGPLRVGFAATPHSDRLQSGSTFYGIMEMSGNLWEYCIDLSEEGLIFDGSNGDGCVSSEGNANETSWPLDNSTGVIVRGGGWNSGDFDIFRDAAISDRFYFQNPNDQRRNTTGGRGIIKID